MSTASEPVAPELVELADAPEQAGPALYPPTGETVVVWAVDVRRWNDDRDYRDEATAFVTRRIPGADLRSARVLQDDAGGLVLAAWTALHADGSFRGRTPDGGLVRAPVMVQLPADARLPS